MLRWMCGKSRWNKIINDKITKRVGSTYRRKDDKTQLRQFGHVERRHVDSVVRIIDQMEDSEIIRGKGRTRKTVREIIKKDQRLMSLIEICYKQLF